MASSRLIEYSLLIDDWAEKVSRTMFNQVEEEEWNQWKSVSQEISAGLRGTFEGSAIGSVANDTISRQIQYIKSLPLESADRITEIQSRAVEAVINGERPDELYKMIMESGEVASSRAKVIARTEIGRATTALTQARALSVGSEGYWWRIKGKGTRPSHYKMKNVFVRWDNPPTLDGMIGHAGCLPNCECWPEVQVPNPK